MLSSDLLPSEYHPYYAGYINIVDDVHLMSALQKGRDVFLDFVSTFPESRLHYAYADGKWTAAEVLVHILDAERVFQYRAFRFARNDKTALPGFEQDDYVLESKANDKSKEEILQEFTGIRDSTWALFASLNENELKREGSASGSLMSVRALGFVICGHQKHHLGILRERYL
ncbi:DinB family protein [Flagellimonas allohymeniacidonis]|uniref:DinB family protein n=1 Tax=Flagellimonas allohymeniacidonis TaxID=2517819 RepID=A0A4Q8QE11_9FLAO|nr:DinB family protein [Allomuricauda hymeniacidonis]TAI48722.1 DinB family protein [Allomuricauda hymeniacidonis]